MATPTAVERPARARIDETAPVTHLLSNGRYRTLLTEAGTGFSAWQGVALTRWAGDRVEDRDGWQFWLRDTVTDALWSPALAEGADHAPDLEVRRTPGSLEFSRRMDGIESRLEVCVSAEDDLELRRLTLVNHGDAARSLEITGCLEVVLQSAAVDASHPAFSKLFVQTEWDPAGEVLIALRRPRGNDERHPCMALVLRGDGALQFETDRVRFLGRGGSGGRPATLRHGTVLGGTTGNVLDPVLAMRRTTELAPGARRTFVFALTCAADREEAVRMLADVRTPDEASRVFDGAQRAARRRLDDLDLSAAEAEAFDGLAGAMLYGDPRRRASADVVARAGSANTVLAGLGIAAGSRLAVARAPGPDDARAAHELLRAQRYWSALGLDTRVLVLVGDELTLAADGVPGALVQPARVLSGSETDAVLAHAHLVVTRWPPSAGDDAHTPGPDVSEFAPAQGGSPVSPARATSREALTEFNGFGGFAAGGREYVVRIDHAAAGGHVVPPLPWVNVIANETFGTLVSESGAGFTWSRNSREYRLTPWSNDPVRDPHGEAFYVRDDETGRFWSPLPGPVRLRADYEMRHGFGSSTCRVVGEGLEHETRIGVARHERLKITRVRLKNVGTVTRKLSVFAYQRLVLGGVPEESGRRVVTSTDSSSHVLLASNRAAGDFAGPVAFAAAVAPAGAGQFTTSDREAFLGRRGTPGRPQAVAARRELAPVFGAGLDPCFAEQVTLELAPGASAEVAFVLGEADDTAEAHALARRCRVPGAVDALFEEVATFWESLVSRVQVRTPSPELDRMVNGWLPYQTLSCRIWGRSAFYQSGGAFGFRDQLQDSMSLLPLDPALPRAQILLHAAHQFVEGDVLHWWHPPCSRGMRTRFADDLLWLPHLAATYLDATGDWSVFDEEARFLTAPALEPGEDEVYLAPSDSGRSEDVYHHCVLAIDRSLATGVHGLPLFGTGDWNDGMNRVGREGRGESVWMAFFLHTILRQFAGISERRGDAVRAARYSEKAAALRAAVEHEAWDGEWYRRGYYDNGAPLGSASSDECRIDALAQAWSVLSGAAPLERAQQAMESVERHLISEPDGLIRLLTPPFHHTPQDPGYIKGYVPGVRENGGQYTHAALWVIRAMVELGWRHRAADLLAMLSPVHHTRDAAAVARYQVEPFVVAADVYGAAPHVGRGGWTWYTGSSGWMYRVALESVLGVRLEGGDTLVVAPCVPDAWPDFDVEWTVPGEPATRFEIHVTNPGRNSATVASASLDGERLVVEPGGLRLPVARDGGRHRLEIELGARP